MAALIHRYGIYWTALDPTMGREVQKTRPCVVISLDEINKGGVIVVCPLTTALHPAWPYRLQIKCAGRDAEIMPDQVRAVASLRIGKFIDALSKEDQRNLQDLLARLYTV
jgi:mRNA interferase MazF